MYAKELTSHLHEALGLRGSYQESEKRFESLRSYERLPIGRDNAGRRLSNEQIANAVLGFVPNIPDWAGHVSLVLSGLRCVGGRTANVDGCETLNCLIAALIGNDRLYESLNYVLLGMPTDISTGDYFARVFFNKNYPRKSISFVPNTAQSLLVSGAEEKFDAESYITEPMRFLALDRKFFRRLSQDVGLSRHLDRPLKTDWREYETEEERAEFYEKLGVKSNSDYLNVGVETTVNWPKEPTQIMFEGHRIVLFPKTKDNSHSISIDLRH